MKSIVIPLTARQIGWIVFFSSFISVDSVLGWSYFRFNDISAGVIGILTTSWFLFICLWVDGKYDINPFHKLGLHLKFKESKK